MPTKTVKPLDRELLMQVRGHLLNTATILLVRRHALDDILAVVANDPAWMQQLTQIRAQIVTLSETCEKLGEQVRL